MVRTKIQSPSNQSPSFSVSEVYLLMLDIAQGMHCLHNQDPPILHRDLKAANVLVHHSPWNPPDCPSYRYGGCANFDAVVADIEYSMGVVGTSFWRAPEILQQLKDRVSSSNLNFTREGDVYSFGMTCYEVVTGRIRFEDHPSRDYDLVLSGNRPELPPDIDPVIKDLIASCWHADPLQRPNFQDISFKVAEAYGSFHGLNYQVAEAISGY